MGGVTKERPLIQMHDSNPGTGTEVAAETAPARMAYVATCELRLYLFSFSFLENKPFFIKDGEKRSKIDMATTV